MLSHFYHHLSLYKPSQTISIWVRLLGQGSLLVSILMVSGCAYVHTPYIPEQTGLQNAVASLGTNGYATDVSLKPVVARASRIQFATLQEQSYFDYQRTSVAPESTFDKDRETDTHLVRHLKFPSVGDNGQQDNLASAFYYQSKKPGKKKLVVVLPIWGSSKYPSTRIAEGIVEHDNGNTNVLLVEGNTDFIDWKTIEKATDEKAFIDLTTRYIKERIRTNIIDMRRWLDWLDTQEEIDPHRMGMVGFSISSIVGSVAYGVDRRMKTGIFVVGGANPDEILANCHWEPAELRSTITARFGWGVDKYRQVLHDIFEPVNPARYGGSADPQRILIFDSKLDTCIPESAREAMWEGWGRPERVSYLHDHKMSFLSLTPLGLNVMRKKIYDFLDKNL